MSSYRFGTRLSVNDSRLIDGEEYQVAVFENDAYTKRRRQELDGTIPGGDGRVHLDELQGGYALGSFTADTTDGVKAGAEFDTEEFQEVEALNGWVDGVKYKAGSDYALVDSDGFLYGQESFVGKNYEEFATREELAAWELPDTPHVRAFADTQDQLDGIVDFTYADRNGWNFDWDAAQQDSMTGTRENDWFGGGAGNDKIRGRKGNDFLIGDNGNDRLRGNRGDDVLWGGTGNDKLHGGKGDDLLFGGEGNDKFVLGAGSDIIADFEVGSDKIILGSTSEHTSIDTEFGALLSYETRNGLGGETLIVGVDTASLGLF